MRFWITVPMILMNRLNAFSRSICYYILSISSSTNRIEKYPHSICCHKLHFRETIKAHFIHTRTKKDKMNEKERHIKYKSRRKIINILQYFKGNVDIHIAYCVTYHTKITRMVIYTNINVHCSFILTYSFYVFHTSVKYAMLIRWILASSVSHGTHNERALID